MLPLAGCPAAGEEVRPIPGAGAIIFFSIKGFVGCWPSLAPDAVYEVVPGPKGGLETWVPLLTSFLGTWVETSAERMLPLGGELSELGGAMDNGEWISLERREHGKGPPGKEWCYSLGLHGRVDVCRGAVYWSTGDCRTHKG